MHHPTQCGLHTMIFATLVVKYWLEREIVYQAGLIRQPTAPQEHALPLSCISYP